MKANINYKLQGNKKERKKNHLFVFNFFKLNMRICNCNSKVI